MFVRISSASSVANKAVNAEDHKTICVEEEPAYRRCKTEYAHTHTLRERETHTHTQRVSLLTKCNSYKEQPTFTKGYKVTLYSD